ncbi:hypothetical protein [Streptomyces sp. NPDC000880]
MFSSVLLVHICEPREPAFHPLVAPLELVSGYAVSHVRAAVRQRGLGVGGVRPPLVDPAPEHLDALGRITDAGPALCAEVPA